MGGPETDTNKFFRELLGLFLLFWAIFLVLGLLSYNSNDPGLNHVVSSKNLIHNKAGLFGAYAAGFLNDLFGVGALVWPFIFAALGATYISAHYSFLWWRWCGFFLLTVCFLVCGAAFDFRIGDLSGGGMVGYSLYANSSLYLSPFGSFLLWLFIFLVGTQLSFNFSWLAIGEKFLAFLRKRYQSRINDDSYTEADAKNNPFWAKYGNIIKRCLPRHGEIKNILQNQYNELKIKIRDTIEKFGGASFEDGQSASYDEKKITLNAPPVKQPEQVKDINLSPPAFSDNNINFSEFTDDIEYGNWQNDASPTEQEILTEDTIKVIQPDPIESQLHYDKSFPKEIYPEQGEDRQEASTVKEVTLPSVELLKHPKEEPSPVSSAAFQEKSKKLIAALKNFDIESELVRINPGPVVTMFEIRPAAGIKVSRIVNLGDDLRRELSAISVRIQAPIPGKDTIGIEIPNDKRQIVNFREIVETDDFRDGCGPLTMILGKDIGGNPYLADLAHMPHLLVAGATGAGKSVCLNCILISLLLCHRPDEMQLLLVDPKRIEMALYADSPHLVHPVVTEMSDAKNALDWAVDEMERRYKAIANLGVRDIRAYNSKIGAFGDNLPENYANLQKIPYLVIVIDELADLMMTASKEVERSIVRLAQLARAAGIHMILATQRPSVDVVTGLIKANFPCRISFQVTSKHDSRTILDQVGAEHLLGHGDMLFKPSGHAPVRLHGPYLSDEECAAVINHWKSQLKPDYKIDFAKFGKDNNSAQAMGASDSSHDSLYEEARKFIIEHGMASTSLLQRQFKIGFPRAGRIMTQFENEGIIGPAEGSKPRAVLIKPSDE